MKDKKAIKAAKKVRKYCMQHTECKGCVFKRDIGKLDSDFIYCEIIIHSPDYWDLKKKKGKEK